MRFLDNLVCIVLVFSLMVAAMKNYFISHESTEILVTELNFS